MQETIICKYIINKLNTIAYNLKELGKRECKHKIYSGSTQLGLRPLFSSFNPKLEILLI